MEYMGMAGVASISVMAWLEPLAKVATRCFLSMPKVVPIRLS